MKEFYYLNKNPQSSGQYELHTENCTFLKMTNDKEYIGYFSNCYEAIEEAKSKNPLIANKIDGCAFCCRPCNHG